VAGSAARGIAAARADLFEGATWFIDRDDATVREIIAACGANAEVVDAAEHDRAVALTSHLPQILSTALAAYLHDQDIDLRFAGPGLRTFLRLAGSEASVWTPILDANRENLRPHVVRIVALIEDVMSGNSENAFAKANELFAQL
jgi:prephenate dehydrogenase